LLSALHGDAGATTPPLVAFSGFLFGALCFQDFGLFVTLQRELVPPLNGNIYRSHNCIFECFMVSLSFGISLSALMQEAFQSG
jgi:hypothetical protein